MMYVKEATVFQNSEGEGNVGAGHWGSGKEVHLFFGTVPNNWPGVSTPYRGSIPKPSFHVALRWYVNGYFFSHLNP